MNQQPETCQKLATSPFLDAHEQGMNEAVKCNPQECFIAAGSKLPDAFYRALCVSLHVDKR